METIRIFRMIKDTGTCPAYRVRIELSFARLLAARIGHSELFCLCFDLDRLFERGDPGFLNPALESFERAWFMIAHGDAALGRRDVATAQRWFECAASIADAANLDAVARTARARLRSS